MTVLLTRGRFGDCLNCSPGRPFHRMVTSEDFITDCWLQFAVHVYAGRHLASQYHRVCFAYMALAFSFILACLYRSVLHIQSTVPKLNYALKKNDSYYSDHDASVRQSRTRHGNLILHVDGKSWFCSSPQGTIL